MKEVECVNCKCKFPEHTCKLLKFYRGDYYILLCDTCLQDIPKQGENPEIISLTEQDKELERLRHALIEIKEGYNMKSEEVKKQRETIVALMEKEQELRHVIENNHNACLYWRERAFSSTDEDRDRIDKPEPEITRFASFGITIIPSLAIDKDTIRCNGIDFKLENLKEG